jgi:hypothetical protein
MWFLCGGLLVKRGELTVIFRARKTHQIFLDLFLRDSHFGNLFLLVND